MNKIYGIEVFRGIAAIMVVFYHVARHFYKNFGEYPLSDITKFGHAGVDFFFTLSGFIILYIHYSDIGKKQQINIYLLKRFVRIYPFFWFVTGLHLLLIPFVASANFPDAFILFKNIVLWPQGLSELINGVSWTLQHEILFYCIFSCIILNRYFGYIIFFIWFSSIFLLNYFLTVQFDKGVLFSAFNLQFLMGMFAAWVLIKFKVNFSKTIFNLGVLLFFTIAYLEVFGDINGYGGNARLLYGMASTLLIIGCVAYERSNGISFPSITKYLGRSSYSIYLTHLFFNGIFFKVFSIVGIIGFLPHWMSCFIIILLIVISACVTSSYIEIPLMRLMRNKLIKNDNAR